MAGKDDRRTFRCSDEEWGMITKMADLAGVPINRFILDRILRTNTERDPGEAKLLQEIHRDIRQVKTGTKFISLAIMDRMTKAGEGEAAKALLEEAQEKD